jgi:hypothetical protein
VGQILELIQEFKGKTLNESLTLADALKWSCFLFFYSEKSRCVMSDSEFHSCLCGSEAGGGMKPAAIACVV